MPAQHSVRFDDMKDVLPPRHMMGKEHEHSTIMRRQMRTSLLLTLEDDHLLSQECVLSNKDFSIV